MSERLDDAGTRHPSQLQTDLAQHEPAPAESAPEQEAPSPEDVIADLRKQLEARDEQQRRLERQLSTAAQERQAAESHAQDAYGASLQAAIDAEKTRLAQAQALIKQAMEAQDYDALLKAQDAFTDAKVQLHQHESEKRRHETQPKQQPRQQAQPRTLSELRGTVSPASQAWIDDLPAEQRDNPDYLDAAIAAHNRAQREGVMPDTPAYFRYLTEGVAKLSPPPQASMAPAPKPRAQIPASSMAAPSSRVGGASARGGSDLQSIAARLQSTVPELEQAALICNMPVDRYAKMQLEILDDERAGRRTGLDLERGIYR